jgi:hypothetical protein
MMRTGVNTNFVLRTQTDAADIELHFVFASKVGGMAGHD